MTPLFKDRNLQNEFEEKGYVVVPFLSEAEVNTLREFYKSKFSDKKVNGLYPTHSRNEYSLTIEVSDRIAEVFKQAASQILEDYKIFFGHFMVKSNVDSQEFELHQDWSVVDESKYTVAQMWCPLVDTQPENGGMFLINGSHHFFSNYRSGSLSRFYIKVSRKTEPHITSLTIKAGSVLFYHNRLIHGSFPNRSNHPRLIAMGNATNANAPYVYYQKSATGDAVNVYSLDREVFLKNLNMFEGGGVPAEFKLLNTLPYIDNPISETDILNKLKINEEGLLKKLANRLITKIVRPQK